MDKTNYAMGEFKIGGTPTTNTNATNPNASTGGSAGYVPDAVTTTDLAPNAKINIPTVNTDTNNYAGVIGNLADKTASDFTSADKAYQDSITANQNTSNQIDSLSSTLLGKDAERKTLEDNAGLQSKREALAGLNSKLQGLKFEAQGLPFQGLERDKGQGRTEAVGQALDQSALRVNAINALGAAAQVYAQTQDISVAEDAIDRQLAFKYDPIEKEIAQKQAQLDRNYQYFTTPAEKKRADALQVLLDKQKQDAADKKEAEKNVSNILLQSIQNGGTPAQQEAIKNSKTLADAITAAGSSLRTPNTEIVKVGDNSAYLIDKNTGKIIKTFGGGSSGGAGGVNTTQTGSTPIKLPDGTQTTRRGIAETIISSGKFTKDQATAIRNAAESGEDFGTVIKNQAKQNLSGANQTKLENNEVSRDAMIDLQKQLQAYYAAGGKTDIFKGNMQEVTNKLGNVGDPRLVSLAVGIASSLQQYRNNISGTAYSDQEGRDIASVFPGINKTEGLNTAIVNQRVLGFNSAIDSYYKTAMGQKAVDYLKTLGNGQSTSSVITSKGNLSASDFVEKRLSSAGLSYTSTVNALMDSPQAKKLKQPTPVIDNETGEMGVVEYSDYIKPEYSSKLTHL